MHLQLHRQAVVKSRVFGLRVSGLQRSGHLRNGLLQMLLGVGTIPSGVRRNPCVWLVRLGGTPLMDGSAYSVNTCTSQTTIWQRLAALHVSPRSTGLMEFVA